MAEESLRGGTSLVAGVGISTVINGLGSIVLARLLGPDDYATYGLALVFTLLLTHFATLGIDTAIVRYIPKLREEGQTDDALGVFKTGIVLRLLVGAVFSVGAFLASDWFATVILARPEMGFLVRFASIAMFFQVVFWLSFYGLQGLQSPGRAGVVKTVQVLVKVLLAILLILYGLGIMGALIGYVIGFVISSAIGAIILTRKTRALAGATTVRVGWRYARPILGFGAPLYAVTIATGFVPQFRLVVLSLFVTNYEIGNFIAALNVTTILTALSYSIIWSLLPAFSRLASVSTGSDYGRGFSLAHKYAVLIVVPAALVMMTLAPEIVDVLYGAEYGAAALFLALLASMFLLVGVGNGLLESFFNGMGEVWLTVALWGLYLGTLVTIGVPFTMSAGTVGIIAADVLSRLFACATLTIYAWRRGHLTINVSSSLRLYLSGVSAAVATVLSRQLVHVGPLGFLIIGAGVFTVVYFTLVPLSGAIDVSDVERIRGAFGGLPVVGVFVRAALWYVRRLLRANDRDTIDTASGREGRER